MSAAGAELGSQPRGITARPPRLLLPSPEQAGDTVGSDALTELQRSGALWRPTTEAVVVYRVRSGEHEQTGVVVEVSVEDYRSGRIRRHEATDPDRERRLVNHSERTGLEQTPVMLTHTPRPALRKALRAATSRQSVVDLHMGREQEHRVWLVDDPEVLRAVHEELSTLTVLYIADGHHRMAAADRYAARRPRLGADHPCGFTLGALFPSDEMRVFGYPRWIPRTEGGTVDEILTALARAPGCEGIEACTPSEAERPAAGTAAVFVDGQWYRLRLRGPRSDVRAALDTVRIDEAIIPSAFGGISGTTVPPEVSGAEDLARWCRRHRALAFLPHPPSVAEVMAVSDAGQVMPAKSTWFDPKAPQGLFLRELRRNHAVPEG